MRNRRHRTRAIDDLRLTIACLPEATREAMLEGLRVNERILVGAYVDRDGGVCPMLAAHRCGGRTDFLSFAHSWDRFTRAGGKSREATAREVDILSVMLRESLDQDSGTSLAEAIAHHRELAARSSSERRRRIKLGDPLGEIRARRLGRAARVRAASGTHA